MPDDTIPPVHAADSEGGDSVEPLAAWAARWHVPWTTQLDPGTVSPDFRERVPIAFARQHVVLGLTTESGRQRLVIGRQESWPQRDILSRWLRRSLEPAFAPPEVILAAIDIAYAARDSQTSQALADVTPADDGGLRLTFLAREDLLDTAERSPVIRLVNAILFDAVTQLASDVHVQPYEDRLVIRFRIDGVLFDVQTLPPQIQEEVLSRVKIVGRMNIAEKRLPQDGRATVAVGSRQIDLRIASLPTAYGERIVIRLLDKSARVYSLPELGLGEETVRRFRQLIRREHGLLLVTGPTGSGKSTTLYATLQELNSGTTNVVTLEDPIEYQLPGISQTQINPKKGLTFASGLRSVLRQDPDIIMVGEIRDQETAVMAIQSALTGHLVLSTLHTNDAASAVTRLLDLGIEPYLVASCLVGVLAQRLVRKNCTGCTQPCEPSVEELAALQLLAPSAGEFRRGAGCAACRQTGFRGRLALSELLVIQDDLRQQIQSQAHAAQLLQTGLQHGLVLMRDDGLAKVAHGLTTFGEVARVTVDPLD
jgi:general secretion pathway protein E